MKLMWGVPILVFLFRMFEVVSRKLRNGKFKEKKQWKKHSKNVCCTCGSYVEVSGENCTGVGGTRRGS